MGRNNNNKKKKKNSNNNHKDNKRNRRRGQQQHKKDDYDLNFFLDAGPGCYIARRDFPKVPEWMIGWEGMDYEELDEQDIPEIAIDPDERSLSICNTKGETVVAYVTIYEATMIGRDGQTLVCGTTTTNEGVTKSCITFIVLCPPNTFAHLCTFDADDERDLFQDIQIESDVQVWNQHPKPHDTIHPSQSIGFPLGGDTPFLCTQGTGGQLTHFFSGNQHAVDFRCPVGTPLLAVGNGTILEVKDNNTLLTGIAVTNLFEWNSIMIQLDPTDGPNSLLENKEQFLIVEYVHIQKATVKVGDTVRKGQLVGYSGSVGFSPEPHLHFAAYRSKELTAPTVGIYFEKQRKPVTGERDGSATTDLNSPSSRTFVPRAGYWYDATGLVQPVVD